MSKVIASARYGAAIFAALASLPMLVAPVERALADAKSTPVTVVNPPTNPSVTSSIDVLVCVSELRVTC